MNTETATITVKGRGDLHVTHVDTDAAGVTIRLDDRRNDEFWAEVRITNVMLADLLAAVFARETEERDGEPDWSPDDVVTLAPEGK